MTHPPASDARDDERRRAAAPVPATERPGTAAEAAQAPGGTASETSRERTAREEHTRRQAPMPAERHE